MACKKGVRNKKFLLASLVTEERLPCAFCQREVDDEVTYGKLYQIGDIQCHYFCVLLSCCLVQKGKDTEGLFGFLYTDIVAEMERSKKHKCSYCGLGGASLGCSVAQCRKQFHLPCGREKNAVSLFSGNYKSFCQQHAPKQKIPPHIMELARMRLKLARTLKKVGNFSNLKELSSSQGCDAIATDTESVCVICYEAVDGFPTVNTFWPVCCARDAWFHRSCLQRMALSAGMHYLKCPLCNDKEQFYNAVMDQGYYVPDRDAAWELEQDAFAGIYERTLACGAKQCRCEHGRTHDTDSGEWDIKLCILCGTMGCHAACLATDVTRFVCAVCRPAAPADLDALATHLEALQRAELAARRASARRPRMPARMSLRRTKGALDTLTEYRPSTSHTNSDNNASDTNDTNTALSRLDLNLKPPRRPPRDHRINIIEENNENYISPTKKTPEKLNKTKLTPEKLNKTKLSPLKSIGMVLKFNNNEKNSADMFSPTKFVEERVRRKVKCFGVTVDSDLVAEKVTKRLRKPRPLSEKKRIVNDLLEDLFDGILKEIRENKERDSPKRTDNAEVQNTHLTPEGAPENKTEAGSTPEKLPSGDGELPLVENANSPVAEKENSPVVENETLPVVENNRNDLDESSSSTFQLPSEFIAERNSDDSLTLFETPKKLKTVEIEKDSSLEISENDQVVNIDMIKMENVCNNNDFKVKIPLKDIKGAFKFNTNKEVLDDSFKNYYLTEVGRDFKCNFNHNHKSEENPDQGSKLRTAIDFAIDASKKVSEKKKVKTKGDDKKSGKKKRKLDNKDGVPSKKRKKDKNIVVLNYKQNKSNIEVVCSNDSKTSESIDMIVEKNPESKKRKKFKKNKKGVRENIHVKIRFKKEQLRLQITKSKQESRKKKLISMKSPALKQYVLQYSHSSSPTKVLAKPEIDVTPKKRKYVKLEKSPDNLVQTSIQNFFKKVPTPLKTDQTSPQ